MGIEPAQGLKLLCRGRRCGSQVLNTVQLGSGIFLNLIKTHTGMQADDTNGIVRAIEIHDCKVGHDAAQIQKTRLYAAGPARSGLPVANGFTRHSMVSTTSRSCNAHA